MAVLLVPTETEIRAARAEADRRRREYGPGLFDRPTRWIGFLGEAVLERWLDELGVDYVHHGGVDRLPDFEISGARVSVKTANRGLWDLALLVPVGQADVDAFFLCAYEQAENRLWLVGGIEARRFVEMARLVDGERSTIDGVERPYRILPASELDPPCRWLATVSPRIVPAVT